jgi:hypothetical protein
VEFFLWYKFLWQQQQPPCCFHLLVCKSIRSSSLQFSLIQRKLKILWKPKLRVYEDSLGFSNNKLVCSALGWCLEIFACSCLQSCLVQTMRIWKTWLGFPVEESVPGGNCNLVVTSLCGLWQFYLWWVLLCLTNFSNCDFWWGSRLSSTAPDVLSGNGRVFYLQQVLNIMFACLHIGLSSLILVLLALCMKYIHVKISSAMLPEI